MYVGRGAQAANTVSTANMIMVEMEICHFSIEQPNSSL
jgi:hypothetical protein